MFHFLTRRERCINTYPAKNDDCTAPQRCNSASLKILFAQA